MKFLMPVESIIQNKGGVILYDPIKNEILKQYVHDKQWRRSGWRGGVIYEDYLYATDWQSIHKFDIKKWEYHGSINKTTWNDLHYLVVKKDQLYIVNTGLDAIESFNLKTVQDRTTTFIFDKIKEIEHRDIDIHHKWNEEYKTSHVCHPNCIALKDGFIFVTCFEDKTRGKKTGKIVELTSKTVVLDKHNCHDGNFYNGDFYLSGTREHQIYIIRNLINRPWPLSIDEKINIGKPGWWRGMIIYNDVLFVFASYAYGENSSCKMAVIDLSNKKVLEIKTLPSFEGIKWDTIYQPNLLEA